jgi:hypothetical protein
MAKRNPDGLSWINSTLSARSESSVKEIALIRLGMRQLHDALSHVTTFADRAVRGASLRSGKLQRCYRDAHAGTNAAPSACRRRRQRRGNV